MHFQGRSSPDVKARLDNISKRYDDLQELARFRKQRLLDALSLYKLYNDADSVEAWLHEKVNFIFLYLRGIRLGCSVA